MMEVKFILTAIFVVFHRLTSVRPNIQTDSNQVRGNLRNFFDAVNKNDARRIGIYHQILEQGAENEQRAFDTMKEDFRLARLKNVEKRIRNGNINTEIKREAPNTGQTTAPSIMEQLDAEANKLPKSPYAYRAGFDIARTVLLPKVNELHGKVDELQLALKQKTDALALIAPVHLRSYIEHITAGFLVGEFANLNVSRKALTEDIGESYANVSAMIKKQRAAMNTTFKEELLRSLGKNSDEVEGEVDNILIDVQRKMALTNYNNTASQILCFMEPVMNEEVRVKLASYYTYWLFILQSEKLSKHQDVIVLKDLMKKNGIEKDEVMAREVSSLWIQTSTFGVHTPAGSKDITLGVLLQGLRRYGMLYENTESVVTTLFKFITGGV